MLVSISSKKKPLLVIILMLFLLQAAVVVFQRREVNFARGVNTSVGRTLTLFKDFVQGKYEKVSLLKTTENKSKTPLDSSRGNTRINVNMKSFKDITTSNFNIFFIESRCGTRKSSRTFGLNTTFNLSPRQCCSIESAATMNPRGNVYILHTCPLGPDFALHLPTYARNVLRFSNVFVVPLSMAEAFDGTPVTSLYRSGQLEGSIYPIVHASDILRLVILWRFGGTYCDMDILFIRSLRELRSNFCGLEKPKAIGNSILNFKPTGHGHGILTKMLTQVNLRFNGRLWTANGPDLITNTMLQECNATMETVTRCTVFTVYGQTVFYPLPWKDHMAIFNSSVGADVVKNLKHSGFTIHFWNNFTVHYSVQVGSTQAYGLLAEEFCPAVYWNCGDKF